VLSSQVRSAVPAIWWLPVLLVVPGGMTARMTNASVVRGWTVRMPAADPLFVTVMLPAVPAWAPDRVGAGRESGSDRNRPSSTMNLVAFVAAWHGRLALAARVAHS
jgi:hypothetical protein